ncbi:hypothetical protein GOP47_0002859 [Adiantum capillus-veneris]|uniref:DUF3727 domain-containing protein n=1 Tax=Adiantum capillus-veneris TaxID=13818 RepID=A0A9D4VAW1_ADICA|nr:hypothetical protein GOP47_0002859 [Adiantum capillus-veneris]
MACSCSSSSFRASPSSRASSSPASASSAPASFSFRHLQNQLSSLSSSTNKHAGLRWDCEKITKQASCVVVTARQGKYDTPRKNTSQRGGGGGRNASLAVKEDKTGRKGGSSGNKNSKQYNDYSNPRSNSSSSNPKFQNNSSSSNPKFQSNSSSNRRGQKLVVVEEKDGGEYEEEGTVRTSRSYNKSNYNNNANTLPYSAKKVTSRSSKFSDDEEEGESEGEFDFDEDADLDSEVEASLEHLTMPIPPAGFVLAEDGSVSVMAPPHKRVATLVDSQTKLPLDCLIRRVFSSSDGRQCFLLCPLDTPLQILKIDDGEVLKEVSDEELEDIFPSASFELAKQRLHLVRSGFCLTLRGGFCFTDEDVMDLSTVYGESGDTTLNEGVEVANFVLNDYQYLIFTPLDPLMFVAYKDEETGELLIAEDDLLEDEAVLDAIDEEKEFQAYMEEDVFTDASSDEEEE